MFKRGGVLPDDYGLSLTVYAQEATEEAPVKAGTPLKLANSGDYHAVKCADGDEIQLLAKHAVQSKDQPLGVYAYGFSRTNEFTYSGEIAVGDSVVADANGGVKKAVDGGGAAVDNGTKVVLVDAANSKVEVILP
ncbi:hypothetical protein SAMN05421743_105213 [Thalassobacillus cyri]|uniref:Bacteriophage lambda head decoration protein D n=1 Tax=Thalassobacillus cyri TaxID=571932 RepID=A0A1H4C055_9BACI|nr:hypothetical protein [Thalassobacillus cyri]SEA53703.1 hypothetical protein SAMN05421743_105213 [Thalassobacillus cyri]